MRAIGLGNMESTMQRKKPFFAYALAAGIAGVFAIVSATPGLARQVHKTTGMTSYQLQSASSSYALAPQTASMANRNGQCWIATDASRGFGYTDSCANPLARDPSLDPTYNGLLHGE
jgi:hypothetical protein